MRFRTSALAAWAMALAALAAPALQAADGTGAEEAAIRKLMLDTWDKPESPLTVAPVVVLGEHALAGWTQGPRGGRAMLTRAHRQWSVTLCAGDGLKDPRTLQLAGLSATEAEQLSRRLSDAEARMPAAERAKFSTFEGWVRMDTHGHPAADHKHPD